MIGYKVEFHNACNKSALIKQNQPQILWILVSMNNIICMKSVIKLLIYTQTLSPGTLKSIKPKIYRYLVIILSASKNTEKD